MRDGRLGSLARAGAGFALAWMSACGTRIEDRDAGSGADDVPLGDPPDSGGPVDCEPALPAAGVTCEQLGGTLIAPRDVWVTRAGRIVATEMGAGRVVRLDGDQWVAIAEGLSGPIGIRELEDGDLVVAEEHALGVFRIDPVSGVRSPIATALRNVTYVALAARGDIFVSSFATVGPDGTGIVWRIDPSSGAAVEHATGLHVPEGVIAEPDGSLVVAEWQEPSSIRRFAPGGGPASGSEEIADGFAQVYGVALDGAGGFFVGDHAGRVVRIRASRAREVVLDGIGRPGGLTRTAEGALLVVEFVDFGAIGRVMRLAGLD